MSAEEEGWQSLHPPEPRTRKRVAEHPEVRADLSKALQAKWKEATTGPSHELREQLQGTDAQFRARLRTAQSDCKELQPIIAAANQLLRATAKESVAAAEQKTKDYRFNPKDGLLERSVFVTRAQLWVPVMPSTITKEVFFRIYVASRSKIAKPRGSKIFSKCI